MIRVATNDDLDELAKLASLLWPENTPADLRDEFADLLTDNDAACFLYFEQEKVVGFAQCQLRHDYVEGTDSTPVGYLEGIFVRENFRHEGRARALLATSEAWALERGCTEFASDCELENEVSLHFHLASGFTEANRIICFTKKLS